MFYYYGAKNQLAKHYQPPAHNLIIEPFGGSGAYSIYHLSQTIVCEKEGANWLEFIPLKSAKTSLNTKYNEVVFYK